MYSLKTLWNAQRIKYFWSNYKLQCYFFWGRIQKGDRLQPDDISYTHKMRYFSRIRSINLTWRFLQWSLAESALSIRFHRTRAVSWPASRARASRGKIPVTTGPTADETSKDGSRQHVVVIRLLKSALTVARERYNWVQLCILSVSPHKLCNLQQADQPRTPDIAHAQYQCMPNGRRLYMTSVRAGSMASVYRFGLSDSEKKCSLLNCRKISLS